MEKQPPPYTTIPWANPSPYATQPAKSDQPTQHDNQAQSYTRQQPSTVGPSNSAGNRVVVTQPRSYGYMNPTDVYTSNAGAAIILSCLVLWCCCPVIGFIAFVFAIQSCNASTADEAQRRIRMSMRLSIAGVITGVVLGIAGVAIYIGLALMFASP